MPFPVTGEMQAEAAQKLATIIKERIRGGDLLPDLPGLDVPGVPAIISRYWSKAFGIPLGVYYALENLEKYWGPQVWDWWGEGDPSFVPPSMPGAFPEFKETPRAPTKPKRKVSKANKAFKKAYAFVTKGFKGKMSQKKCRYFMRKASKMAGKANPHTKSRIGKSKNAITRHCRKIRKGVWGVTKHG